MPDNDIKNTLYTWVPITWHDDLKNTYVRVDNDGNFVDKTIYTKEGANHDPIYAGEDTYIVNLDDDYFRFRGRIDADGRKKQRDAKKYIELNRELFGLSPGQRVYDRQTVAQLLNGEYATQDQAQRVVDLFPTKKRTRINWEKKQKYPELPYLVVNPGVFDAKAGVAKGRSSHWSSKLSEIPITYFKANGTTTTTSGATDALVPYLIYPTAGYEITLPAPPSQLAQGFTTETTKFDPSMRRYSTIYNEKQGGTLNYFNYFT